MNTKSHTFTRGGEGIGYTLVNALGRFTIFLYIVLCVFPNNIVCVSQKLTLENSQNQGNLSSAFAYKGVLLYRGSEGTLGPSRFISRKHNERGNPFVFFISFCSVKKT